MWVRDLLRKGGSRAVVGRVGYLRLCPLATRGEWIFTYAPITQDVSNSWHNAHKKLAWCTEREGRVIDLWVAFSDVVIVVGRLVREAWSRYRWDDRPSRQP